jgi:hypothetical protein
MVALNTHTAVKRLIASGFSEQQSEAIVEVGSISEYKKEQDNIKADIVDIKADIKIMKADIANIKENMVTKADLAELKTGFKNEISLIKADIAILSSSISNIKWLIPICVAIGVALIKYF